MVEGHDVVVYLTVSIYLKRWAHTMVLTYEYDLENMPVKVGCRYRLS